MPPLRIGFAGAGHIAGVHASILSGDARVAISAVHDPDAAAAGRFAARTGAVVAPSLDDLLGAADVLYVCAPNAAHAAIARRGLEAGLHVFSEKPMATTLADARLVAEAAARARGVYQAGFNRRFAPVYVELKRRIVGGWLAPLAGLLKMNRGELRQPPWTGDPAVSGGFLYETPVHILDMARHLLGEPTDVVCRARASVYGQLDDFAMILTFASGCAVTLTASAHATWLSPFERVELYGDHRTAATEEMERLTFVEGADGSPQVLEFSALPFEERWGYVEEDRRFIDALCGAGRPAVDATDALATVALVDRCYSAAAGGAGSV